MQLSFSCIRIPAANTKPSSANFHCKLIFSQEQTFELLPVFSTGRRASSCTSPKCPLLAHLSLLQQPDQYRAPLTSAPLHMEDHHSTRRLQCLLQLCSVPDRILYQSMSTLSSGGLWPLARLKLISVSEHSVIMLHLVVHHISVREGCCLALLSGITCQRQKNCKIVLCTLKNKTFHL